MIKVDALQKSFGERLILDHLSLDIRRGEFIGIIGPSGCGKTTLLSILATLDRPDAGEYHIDGKDMLSLSEPEVAAYRNRHFGFVFQSSNLLMDLSVMDNIAMPFQYGAYTPSKVIRDRVKTSLESVGLEGQEHRQASLLSGGEQQRVAIARALIKHPQIIFADEPTGNLDARNSDMVLDRLRISSSQEQKTVIMVTHDAHAIDYCTRIIEMSKYDS